MPKKKAKKEKKEKTIYRYKDGARGFVPGIPARDISIKWAKDRGIVNIIESCGLYYKE